MGRVACPELADSCRFVVDAGAGQRLRPRPFAAPLPVRGTQHVDRYRQQVIGERPVGGVADQRPVGCRLAGQVPDENAEPAPTAVDDQRTKVGVVEPLEVGLDRSAVLAEETVEADDSPTLAPV